MHPGLLRASLTVPYSRPSYIKHEIQIHLELLSPSSHSMFESFVTLYCSKNYHKCLPMFVDQWTYIGCYKDDRPRDLTSYHKDVSLVTGMSLERCYKFCSKYKNKYMALQNG